MKLVPFDEHVEIVSPVKIEGIMMTVKKDPQAKTLEMLDTLPKASKLQNEDGTTSIRGVVVYGMSLENVHKAVAAYLAEREAV